VTADVHTLAGAYALDALPPGDLTFFEGHLAVCGACAIEVAELQATAAVLGAMTAERPPPTLRGDVLRAVDVVRQLPPRAHPASRARPTGRRLVEGLLGSVAAVLAAALLVLSGVAVHLNQRVSELEAAAPTVTLDEEALAVLAAADAETRLLDTAEGTSARFLYSPSLDAGVFVGHGLQPLDAGSTYELWLFHDGTPRPAALFDTDSEGRAVAVVDGAVVGAEYAAVTVEPHGGSPQPTGSIVAEGPVS